MNIDYINSSFLILAISISLELIRENSSIALENSPLILSFILLVDLYKTFR